MGSFLIEDKGFSLFSSENILSADKRCHPQSPVWMGMCLIHIHSDQVVTVIYPLYYYQGSSQSLSLLTYLLRGLSPQANFYKTKLL
jgi:hypothetical protein